MRVSVGVLSMLCNSVNVCFCICLHIRGLGSTDPDHSESACVQLSFEVC